MKDADHTGCTLWGLQPVVGVVTPQLVLPAPCLVASQMTPRDCSAQQGMSRAASSLSTGCRGKVLFRVVCLKKHLFPRIVPPHEELDSSEGGGITRSILQRSAQLGKETCKENAGALGSAAYKLSGDAFLGGGGAYGVGVGEGDGVRCHGQVEGTRSILAVPNMLGGSKSVWLSPCT